MEDQAPLTLMKLASQRLLKEEALIIATLEDLPMGLLLEIFDWAFTDGHTNILRAMVPAWPSSCLPVGALIKDLHLDILKLLLDEVDVLIREKLYSRRKKLRVLDLTQVHHESCSMGCGTHEGDCSPQAMTQKQPVEICPKYGEKKHFMVVADFKIMMTDFNDSDERRTYLLQWAQQHKGSIHLCCRKLDICNSSIFTARQIFKMINLDCVLELELSGMPLRFMVKLFHFLKQLKNLHTLVLKKIWQPSSFTAAEQKRISIMISRFSKLLCLRNLYVNDVYFLTDCLEEWLRCMKTPLETLSITDCLLSQSNMDYLSQCWNICDLRHLNLSGIVLSDLFPHFLGVLERLTNILQTLELQKCEMQDSHFNGILPILSQCSQLTKVNFYHNNISLCVLKNLLHHTAKLSKLTQELYPAPLECYNYPIILKDKFKQLCPELLDILRAQRGVIAVSFATRACTNCLQSCFYDLWFRNCNCP